LKTGTEFVPETQPSVFHCVGTMEKNPKSVQIQFRTPSSEPYRVLLQLGEIF